MNKKNKQINLQDWKLETELGISYYHVTYRNYEVELHDFDGGTQIGIFKNGNLQKPYFLLDMPLLQFTSRYESVMLTIDDIIDSINIDL